MFVAPIGILGVGGLDASEWSTVEMDTSLDTAGTSMDVALDPVTGAPFVSFYDEDQGDLWMARYVGSGGNCGDGNSWSCTLVDSYGDVGKHNSIAAQHVGPGTRVAIAYYNATTQSLKEADLACTTTCTGQVVTVDLCEPPRLPGSKIEHRAQNEGDSLEIAVAAHAVSDAEVAT